MEDNNIKKAVRIIMGLNVKNGSSFVITIGRLLHAIKNPDTFEKEAISFFDKYFINK